MGAFSDYTSLKATLAGWVHRSDVNGSATGVGVNNAVDAWIDLFEAWANRMLREWDMETTSSLSVSTEYVDAPTTMLELKSMVLTDGDTRWALEPAPQWVVDRALTNPSQTGRPEFYAMVGGQFRYFPAPDQTYNALATYYAGITPLSDASPTNWLLTLAPDAYLYGALTSGAPYLRDMASMPVWKGMRDEAMAAVNSSQRQPSARLRNDFARAPGRGGWDITTDQ